MSAQRPCEVYTETERTQLVAHPQGIKGEALRLSQLLVPHTAQTSSLSVTF